MKKTIILSLVTIFALMFSSCAMSRDSSYAEPTATESAVDYSYDTGMYQEEMGYELNFSPEVSYEEETAEMASGDAAATTDALPAEEPVTTDIDLDTQDTALQNRKIIYTAYLDVETTNYSEAITSLEEKVADMDGYVQSKYADNPTNDYSSRYSTYTLKVPYYNYSAFMKSVGDIGSVLWSEEQSEDVTLEYVDVESRLLTLNAERDSLLVLLESATEVEEIVTIQQYLGDVQYEIERYTARQRQLDDLVQYCTVTVNIYEVKDYTPVESSFIEDIGFAIQNSIYYFVDDTQDFVINLIYALPSLLVFALFVLIVIIIVRKIVKRAKKKALDKAQNAPFNSAQYAPNMMQNYNVGSDGTQSISSDTNYDIAQNENAQQDVSESDETE